MLKSLPVADKMVGRLIKSYFNLSPVYERKDDMINRRGRQSVLARKRRLRVFYKRLSMQKSFVSRAEMKHSNNKVIFTVYVYNREKKLILKNLKTLEKQPLNLYIKNNQINGLSKKLYICYKKGLKVIKKVNKEKKLIKKSLFLPLAKDKMSAKAINKNYENLYKKIFIKKFLKKEMLSLYYHKMFNFNLFKFKNSFLVGLKNTISKIYKKKVEFNLVNLKYIHLNSDMLSDYIVTKLRNRKNRILTILKECLTLVKMPSKKIPLNILSNEKKLSYNEKIFSVFSPFLAFIDSVHKSRQNGEKNVKGVDYFLESDKLNLALSKVHLENGDFKKSNVEKSVLNSIKHKSISGVRLQGKGRLTKRLTASRSIFKFRYKGSLKNIDSSYKGLSTVMLRGHFKSNMQYTKISSKTRNGSFGLKT